MLLFLFFAYCLRSGGWDFCDYGLFVCLVEIFMGFGGLFAGFLFLLLSEENGMTCVEHNREGAEYEKFCSH